MDNRKIVVMHNKIIVNNYTSGDCPELERIFDIYNPATFSYKTVAVLYDRQNKVLTLPRGMSISKLENMFGVNAFFDNSYIRPNKNMTATLIKYPPRDEKQSLALQFLHGTGEYSYTKKFNQLYLALDTGVGKTYLGIVYTALLNVKTIIITTGVDWLTQWKNAIQEHSNVVSSEIFHISGSSVINSIIKNPKKYSDKHKIFTCTHSTIQNYAQTNGWESIDILFRSLGIGLKIIDEAHLAFDNIYRIDYACPVYKTLYLSATPGRSDSGENKVYMYEYFSKVPRLNLFDPENDPHTKYVAIMYKSAMTEQEKNAMYSLRGFQKTKYSDTVVLKPNFGYISMVVMGMIYDIPGKKLLFFASNNAILIFQQWLLSYYPELGDQGKIGVYTSINPEKEKAKECEYILTTSKSAGAALDIKGLAVSVNMAEPSGSELETHQRFGRTRGMNTLFIDLVDVSVPTCKKYYTKALPMYDKYALSTKQVDLTRQNNLENTAYNVMLQRKYRAPFARMNGDKILWW